MKNSILVDEPMEMEVVTTVVTSEVLESGKLPIITEDKFIEYPTPEVNVIKKNDDNEENAETTIVQDAGATYHGGRLSHTDNRLSDSGHKVLHRSA